MTNWWQLTNVGACRQTALSANFFSLPQQFACENFWQVQPTAAFAYQTGFRGDYRRVRILMVAAVPSGQGVPVSPGTEYYAFSLAISNTNTVGEGACAGCTDRVCIVLSEISLFQPLETPGGNLILEFAHVSQVATWQGGTQLCGAIVEPPPPSSCTTPVLKRTWGQIKSLYR